MLRSFQGVVKQNIKTKVAHSCLLNQEASGETIGSLGETGSFQAHQRSFGDTKSLMQPVKSFSVTPHVHLLPHSTLHCTAAITLELHD